MAKANIYIVVKDGLVQDVYLNSLFDMEAEVTVCDLDDQDSEEFTDMQKFVKEDLPQFAKHIY